MIDSMPIYFLLYYLVINLSLFLLMGYDKRQAKKAAQRVPESTLFILSLLGGAIGGFFGMRVWRHKTKKPAFYIIFALSLFLHLLLLFFILYYVLPGYHVTCGT